MTTSNEEKLTQAYHAVFDVKDTVAPNDPAFYLAYEACAKIKELMKSQGMTPPRRFDIER